MSVDHFSYGLLTPVLSYTLSVLGCVLGLVCTARARTMTGGQRARWLLMAAWAIGGTGIWVMHFMAMIGFTVDRLTIRYDVPITLASLIIAVLVVGIGLFIAGYGRPTVAKVLVAGVFTGVGVAAMHYTGMAAMQMPAHVGYDRTGVVASVVIAVVAATVALWFTVSLRKGVFLFVAALIMGVAVNGMHFTGMYALRIGAIEPRPTPGILPIAFIAPIVVFVVSVIIVLMAAMLNRANSEDRAGDGMPYMINRPMARDDVSPRARRTSPSAFVTRQR